MARIRSVHPGLFTDEAFASLSMAARVLLLGIWTESDDQGVFEWKPVTLKMRIFSADNLDVVPLLAELEHADAIRQFSFEGKPHGAVRNFCKYQKPKTPKFRDVTEEEIRKYVASKYQKEETVTVEKDPFPQKGEMDRQREEGGDSLSLGVGLGGGEKKPAPAKVLKGSFKEEGSCLDPAFQPKSETVSALEEMGFVGEQYRSELSKFMAYYLARGAFRVDWDAGLISWFQRAAPVSIDKPPKASKKIHVKTDTPQWDAWCRYLGKTPPTDNRFGWMFDSEWPPDIARTA